MLDEIKRLRKELLVAYQMIRAQAVQICDLHMLVAPLIRALDRDLEAARLQRAKEMAAELSQERTDTLALIDEAIRRLRVT